MGRRIATIKAQVTVAVGAPAVSVVAAATLGSAPMANATRDSFFGIGNGNG